MKTYDDKFLRSIIENFNQPLLSISDFVSRMEEIGFGNGQDIPEAIGRDYLVFHQLIDDVWYNIYVHYEPVNKFDIADFKTAYKKFVEFVKTHSGVELLNYKENQLYKNLEYLYNIRSIEVKFMYIEEEDND